MQERLRIPGKGVHVYKGVGVRFADFVSYIKYPMKRKYFGLTETKLFRFHRIFNNGEGRTPFGSATVMRSQSLSNIGLYR